MKEVPAAGEGTGRKDTTAPVAGAQRSPVDEEAFLKSIYEGLPEKKRAKFAERLLKNRPDQIAAAKHKRREWIRAALTGVFFFGIIADAGAALYFAQVAKSVSWDTTKDWLTLALAPLVVAATVAATFWFPSKEAP